MSTASETKTLVLPRGDERVVVFVLLLVQCGTILLAMLGELLFMAGLPFYMLAPLARMVITLVFGTMLMRGRRAGAIGLVVLEAMSLTGFVLSALVGVLPQVDFTPTVTGVATGVVLPIIVIVYCVRLVAAWKPSSKE